MSDGQRAWLGLGSNLGDRAALIAEAVRRLDALPGVGVTGRSALYRTPPWGDVDQGEFLNAALAVRTTLSPHALLDAVLAIETALGRVRARRWGPRLIDIDILHYEGARFSDERLTLPHPELMGRAFALAPLAEIAPDLAIGGVTVSAALAGLDGSGIARLSEEPAGPAGPTAGSPRDDRRPS